MAFMSSGNVQVLEEEEYHRRKGYYLDSLQRHYYFMNVGNGEVIDACRKVTPCIMRLVVRSSCHSHCHITGWGCPSCRVCIIHSSIESCVAGLNFTLNLLTAHIALHPMPISLTDVPCHPLVMLCPDCVYSNILHASVHWCARLIPDM